MEEMSGLKSRLIHRHLHPLGSFDKEDLREVGTPNQSLEGSRLIGRYLMKIGRGALAVLGHVSDSLGAPLGLWRRSGGTRQVTQQVLTE